VIVPRDPHEPITPAMWEALRAAWLDSARLAAAWQLAKDVEALADLLAGRAVDPSRLDPDELIRSRRRRLVRLVAPAELLEEGTA
jgi:hypothetical protein